MAFDFSFAVTQTDSKVAMAPDFEVKQQVLIEL